MYMFCVQSIHIEGSKVDIFPISLTLPAKSEPQDIKLLTVPTEPGLLDVKGTLSACKSNASSL